MFWSHGWIVMNILMHAKDFSKIMLDSILQMCVHQSFFSHVVVDSMDMSYARHIYIYISK